MLLRWALVWKHMDFRRCCLHGLLDLVTHVIDGPKHAILGILYKIALHLFRCRVQNLLQLCFQLRFVLIVLGNTKTGNTQ